MENETLETVESAEAQEAWRNRRGYSGQISRSGGTSGTGLPHQRASLHGSAIDEPSQRPYIGAQLAASGECVLMLGYGPTSQRIPGHRGHRGAANSGNDWLRAATGAS